MFFEKVPRRLSSLNFRLTMWFVTVFSLCLIVIFVGFYYIAGEFLYRSADRGVSYELEEAVNKYHDAGIEALANHIVEEANEYGEDKVFFRVLSPEGKVLHASNLLSWGTIPVSGTTILAVEELSIVSEMLQMPKSGRIVRIVSRAVDSDIILQGGVYIDEELTLMRHYRVVFPLVGIVVVLMAGITGYFVVSKAMRRVEGVTQLANQISSGNLAVRLPIEIRDDEIGQLSTTFNRMLDRIQGLVKGMKQVTDDVAHELRSPITRIRTRAELALIHVDENQISLAENTIEECDRILELINTMLDISEADSGAVSMKEEVVNLGDIVQDAIELFQPVAEARGIQVDFEGDGGAFVKGDLSKLQRAISNVLDNAIKFTLADGKVMLRLKKLNVGKVQISVQDSGIGVSKDSIPLVFERFYRADTSRSTPGSGLGLTLSKSIVEAHKGEMFFVSRQGKGTTVSIQLPLVEERS